MMIFKLVGGLGNQLFIYAFARSLSFDLDQELILDISAYGFNVHEGYVTYGLHPYAIKAIVGNYPSYAYKETDVFKGALKIYEYGEPLTHHGTYLSGLIEENINNIEYPAYFTGYYSFGFDEKYRVRHDERFFIHNEDIIRKDLTYLPDIDDELKGILEDIRNSNSVAIHIRRGDYKYLDKFGMCSKEYYHEAIEKISSMVENPKFFIFTNDEEWTKNNINIPFPYEFVDNEKSRKTLDRGAAELLKMLSSCKHFIMANSTFSWWGAWLSDNEDKIIISPYPWYQSREILFSGTFSNKKPILIENNYKEIFNESDITLFDISNYTVNGQEVSNSNFLNVFNDEIKTQNPVIHIPELTSIEGNQFMVKIGMETNSIGHVYIKYKIKDEDNEKIFRINYYENDKFEQYVFIPSNIDLNSVKIQLANNTWSEYSLKSLEIRSIINTNKDEEDNVFPIFHSKFDKINTMLQDYELRQIFSKHVLGRIDIKNSGNSNNSVTVEDSTQGTILSYPEWFENEKGKGLVVRSTAGHLNLKIKCINDGVLELFLRGEDIRDYNGNRIPIYMKFTELILNNDKIFDEPKYVHHNQPFYYKKEVKNNEIIDIQVKWDPI